MKKPSTATNARRNESRAPTVEHVLGEQASEHDVGQAEEKRRQAPGQGPVPERPHESRDDELAERRVVVPRVLVRKVAARRLHVVVFVPLESLGFVQVVGAESDADHDHAEEQGDQRPVRVQRRKPGSGGGRRRDRLGVSGLGRQAGAIIVSGG